ncbi:type II secretion system protein [Gemmiger sp.]|uniref:type II secretion system protein n=1 Tax=Gemmiger sp. TaxID=2049027 RepID=UPI002F9407CB
MFTNVKKKKGFTLVELIVVLVILAILAALLVPALTGYIDKAKEKKVIAETRMVVMAVQTVASEAYGQIGAGNDLSDILPDHWTSALGVDGKYIAEIKKLAEVFDSNPKATFHAEIN